VPRSAGFLLKFFALAGTLFWLWNFAGASDLYARLVVAVAEPAMWLTSGYHVESATSTDMGLNVVVARGQRSDSIPMRPHEMFSGLIPFLALLGASSGVTARRRLRAFLIGVAVLFVFHIGLMVIGVYMTGLPQSVLPVLWMRRVNRVIDVFYGFYGLIGYAALPFLLWFWLLRPEGGAGSFAGAE
jgi:hypothetical protein